MTKFRETRGVWGSSPENFYIFEALEALGTSFLKQICKRIGCKLTVLCKNYYFIMQILPENVKIFNLNFS